ncbi:MAG: YjbQ family protein [Actinomycetota bacterium]
MRTHHVEMRKLTAEPPGFVDVTDDLSAALAESGIVDGQVTVFAPDASCSIVVNELESGLLEDVRRALERMRAHDGIAPLIGSASIVLPAVGGRLRLGTWQRVLLVELDKASDRELVIRILGE